MGKYTENERRIIVKNFIEWCERIGYSGDDGVNVQIIDGLPVVIHRSTQSVRFDVLTRGGQDATME